MATLYLDPVNGSDAADGSSFANRVKTINGGITAGRTAPGDVIRIMKSPDPTLLDSSASWTNKSNTVTLQSAVTATIDNCETAWTGSANVTATRTTNYRKEGSYCASLAIASAFTTGKVAYFATGTLNLSSYQQLSLWFRSNTTLAANRLSIRLCSDTTGDTTVHTFVLPQVVVANQWIPVTLDLGSAMSSSIASVALYADVDPGALTIYLDNILACKAPSSADSLTLTSLIGKVYNLSWVANTSYSQNTFRRPTQPNRNGLLYKATTGGTSDASTEPTWPTEYGATVTDGSVVWTCWGVEETWYCIRSISGTTVTLDGFPEAIAGSSNARGYFGATESVATYKREPFLLRSSSTSSFLGAANEDGNEDNISVYSGGWDSTNMSAQDGETWIDCGGYGTGLLAATLSAPYTWLEFRNLNYVRADTGCYAGYVSACAVRLRNCSFLSCSDGLYAFQQGGGYAGLILNGVTIGACAVTSLYACGFVAARGLRVEGHTGSANSPITFQSGYGGLYDLYQAAIVNNYYNPWQSAVGKMRARYVDISDNTNSNSASGGGIDTAFENCVVDATFLSSLNFGTEGSRLSFHNYGRTDGDHRVYYQNYSGTSLVQTATDQRHTASGYAWKFSASSSYSSQFAPMRLPLARLLCEANTQKTVSIWVRRDSTGMRGALVVKGGQIKGVPTDVVTATQPSANTWTQYQVQFTPTEKGVVEIEYQCWINGASGAVWVDDLGVS